MPKITTDRLILREYKFSDWQDVHQYASNPDILHYEAWGPNTKEQTKEYIQRTIKDNKAKLRFTYELCIILRKNKQLIGGCGFRIKKDDVTRGDFGYIIHPDYWNNGFATEAACGLIDYMMKKHNIKVIEATCDVLNIASRKVIEKCGLELIETRKNDIEMKGRVRDSYMFEKVFSH